MSLDVKARIDLLLETPMGLLVLYWDFQKKMWMVMLDDA